MPFLVLLSSLSRNKSAPEIKKKFEFISGILEGRTIRAWPSRPFMKICQNGTFWSEHGIWKFFGPKYFIWGVMKVPLFDFIQEIFPALSSSVQVLIWENRLDYIKNPSQDFKNSFCLGLLGIPRKTGGQNWRGPIFFKVQSDRITVWFVSEPLFWNSLDDNKYSGLTKGN